MISFHKKISEAKISHHFCVHLPDDADEARIEPEILGAEDVG